jgi:hypothetical protein
MKKVVHIKAMDAIEDDYKPEHSELHEKISLLVTEKIYIQRISLWLSFA